VGPGVFYLLSERRRAWKGAVRSRSRSRSRARVRVTRPGNSGSSTPSTTAVWASRSVLRRRGRGRVYWVLCARYVRGPEGARTVLCRSDRSDRSDAPRRAAPTRSMAACRGGWFAPRHAAVPDTAIPAPAGAVWFGGAHRRCRDSHSGMSLLGPSSRCWPLAAASRAPAALSVRCYRWMPRRRLVAPSSFENAR
jgi:hypothetical protein